MQVFGLQRQLYQGAHLAGRLAAQPDRCEAARRDAVRRWQEARAAGLTAIQAARAVGVPASTLYRWQADPRPRSRAPRRKRARSWPAALVEAIERLRRDFPMWGKAKLGPLVRAEGFAVSDSTVGRILGHLVARGAVLPVPVARRRAGRGTARRKHARRLPKGLTAARPGALVQLDTLTVNPTGARSIKHFTAYDPIARFTVAHGRPCLPARHQPRRQPLPRPRFLDKVQAALPFPVRGIQVDGGSEFMAAYDLPHELAELNQHIDSFAHLYNHHRPHGALRGQTPAAYLGTLTAQETQPSH